MIITPKSPLRPNDVLSIKLTSGEELVARFKSETDNHLTVTIPLAIGLNPQDGLLALTVFMFGPEIETSEFPLNKNLIVAYLPANPQLAKDYMNRTSTIQIPSAAQTASLIK